MVYKFICDSWAFNFLTHCWKLSSNCVQITTNDIGI